MQGLGHVGVEFGFVHPGHGGDLGFLEGLFGAAVAAHLVGAVGVAAQDFGGFAVAGSA